MKLSSACIGAMLFALVATNAVHSQEAVALTGSGRLLAFDLSTPGAPTAVVNLTGLASGETIVGMDFRPINRTLVAVTNQSRVVTINPVTGVAASLSVLSVLLSGTAFGVDFNPVPDRLRIVSDTGQDLRVNVDTGAVVVDGTLAYGAGDANFGVTPAVSAAAYTNSVAGRLATATTLYDIDYNKDILVRQNPPNNGTLLTVGALGADFNSAAAMDIFSPTTAYATSVSGSSTSLYTVNLATGAASVVGSFEPGVVVADFAITPKEMERGIINTSARGMVAPGEGVVITGFVIGGTAPVNVLISTRGPSLAQFGVVNPLMDTRVTLYRSSTMLDSNDDWQTHARSSEITASGFAPMNAKEGAIIATLAPGTYSALASGVGTATNGIVLVEVYELP